MKIIPPYMVATVYMENFYGIKFNIIEIVMSFHNIRGVEFPRIQFCTVY